MRAAPTISLTATKLLPTFEREATVAGSNRAPARLTCACGQVGEHDWTDRCAFDKRINPMWRVWRSLQQLRRTTRKRRQTRKG
jgi:hypothetical protein